MIDLHKFTCKLTYISDVPNAKHDAVRKFLGTFHEDVDFLMDGGTWKVQSTRLDRELQERDGELHSNLKTCGNDVSNLLTKYILVKMKKKKLLTADCPVHLVMKEF